MEEQTQKPLIEINEHVYIFTGRVIPERAIISVGEMEFLVGSINDDVPEGHLYVEIVLSQISARYLGSSEVKNLFSLRNLVEETVRFLLDAVGYYHGYAYNAEIIQVIRPFSAKKHVFGIDIPVLKGLVEQAGISIHEIFTTVVKCGNHLKESLSDVREAIKSPRDTGFFCYRAIESLKNCCADRNHGLNDAQAWSLFRQTYSIGKDDIMRIKHFADAPRHGNYTERIPMSDEDRAEIFVKTWKIITKFIIQEKNSPPLCCPPFIKQEKEVPNV